MAYNPQNPNGQATSANSAPVVIASDQSTLAVSLGGLSTFFNSALFATVVAIKASAGKLYGYNLYNPNTSTVFIQFFDAATGSVTLGTTAPKFSLALPSNTNAFVGLDTNFPIGITFSTAISAAATTTAAGSVAPSTGLVTNIWYL